MGPGIPSVYPSLLLLPFPPSLRTHHFTSKSASVLVSGEDKNTGLLDTSVGKVDSRGKEDGAGQRLLVRSLLLDWTLPLSGPQFLCQKKWELKESILQGYVKG